MSRRWGPASGSAPPRDSVITPTVVLGIEGIYDIPALIEYHKSRPYYDQYDAFIHSAFGHQHQRQQDSQRTDIWTAASPTSGEYDQAWTNCKLAVLAHSHEDELVEWEQVELMKAALERNGLSGGDESGKRVVVCELSGKHDEVWSDGKEVARAVKETITMMMMMMASDHARET